MGIVQLDMTRRQLLQLTVAKLWFQVVFNDAFIAVSGGGLDLRENDIVIPEIRPLGKSPVCRHHKVAGIHLHLMAVERMFCFTLGGEGLIFSNAFTGTIFAIVKTYAEFVFTGFGNAAVCHTIHLSLSV